MEAPTPTHNTSVKIVEIENNNKKYVCKIQPIEESIEVKIFQDNSLKYKGVIFLEHIQIQIKTFIDYNINEIFKEINLLNYNDFSLIKESNKIKLKIQFIILRKEKNILINLNENNNKNLSNDELINHYENIIKQKDKIISELKEIIQSKDEKIKVLEEQLKNINKKEKINDDIKYEINYNLYNDYNIKLKQPIHKLNIHTDPVLCLTLLNDGRLVSGSSDKSIIIYNKTKFQPDLIIKEHNDSICYIIQINSGNLVSCSGDKTIKIFNIKGNEYETLQTLNYHTNYVYKIIELKNKFLVSCSEDASILFYFKDNFEYKKDYKISTNGSCSSVIQTKENEICYSEATNNTICFFDLSQRKIKTTINNISKYGGIYEHFMMITKDLLIIPGQNKLSIINVNQYRLIRVIDVEGSNWIAGVCMLNENMILTGDYEETIRQWRIEGDNLILISKKEKTHDSDISFLLNLGNGHIASASDDSSIKIW